MNTRWQISVQYHMGEKSMYRSYLSEVLTPWRSRRDRKRAISGSNVMINCDLSVHRADRPGFHLIPAPCFFGPAGYPVSLRPIMIAITRQFNPSRPHGQARLAPGVTCQPTVQNLTSRNARGGHCTVVGRTGVADPARIWFIPQPRLVPARPALSSSPGAC